MPNAVVTLTLPLVPPATTAVIVESLTTINEVAIVPPKLTEEAPVKLAPLIVTVVPVLAVDGANELILGTDITKTNPAIVAMPPGVVTLTVPLAPLPTTAII